MMHNITIKKTSRHYTAMAGLLADGKFADSLGLTTLLRQRLSIKRGWYSRIYPEELLFFFILGVLAGAGNMKALDDLRQDPVLFRLFNWQKLPKMRTISTIFSRFTALSGQELEAVQQVARKRLWARKGPSSPINLEMSLTETNAAGVQRLLCFVAETRECLGGRLIPAGGVERMAFIKTCLARLPKSRQPTAIRVNSAFFSADNDLGGTIIEKDGCGSLILTRRADPWFTWCENKMTMPWRINALPVRSTLFQGSLMAYNLLVWQIWLTKESDFRKDPEIFWNQLLHVPAQLSTSGHQHTLHVPAYHPFHERWAALSKALGDADDDHQPPPVD
ncbi:MAG: hypothetical protein NTZ24_13880 [Deltaproteobacteria bacterium]|nr:hypothetical protein [Deltaproteobacteria bacterium]